MPPPPKASFVFTERLNVDAACVSGFGADPAPNLIIVSVTFADGKPCTGLEIKDFTLVNYSMTDGQPRLRSLRSVEENAVISGIYNVEPEQEPEITDQVGQTSYAVRVSKFVRSFPFS